VRLRVAGPFDGSGVNLELRNWSLEGLDKRPSRCHQKDEDVEASLETWARCQTELFGTHLEA
jgi:hypothetical protein